EHLCGADVRAAEHAHFTVGVGLRSNPLDGVIAIVGFVDKGAPFSIGGEAPAHVLNEDDIAVRGGALRETEIVAPSGSAIGGALQQRGEFSFGIGTDNVAAKNDAIAHLDGNVALDLDGI